MKKNIDQTWKQIILHFQRKHTPLIDFTCINFLNESVS